MASPSMFADVESSVGACTVAEVAGSDPDLVGRVILEDPPWRMAAPDVGAAAPTFDGVRSWIA